MNKAVIQAVGEFLTSREFAFDLLAGGEALVFGTNGQQGIWRTVVTTNQAGGVLTFLSRLPARVPVARRSRCACLLARLNHGNRLGLFQIDMENGLVELCVSTLLPESAARPDLAEERGKILESAKTAAAEEGRSKLAEKEKLIGDLQKQIGTLKQKAEQGSMQMQGEVLELALQDDLTRRFPLDAIVEVAKGVKGGDVLHRVRRGAGLDCGTILWEAKRTKNWGKDWTAKVKQDQREAKADVVVIVTQVLRAKRRAALAELGALTQSLFLDLFGDPLTNPKGWPRVEFGELLDNIDSGWSPTCLDRPVVGKEWGILKLGAVTWCEYNAAENKALPPDVEPDATIEVKAGDLLFARKNTYELVAACALVRETPPRLLMSDRMFRLRLRPGAKRDSTFLQQLLIYPTKRREIQKFAGGSAGSMPNISKARLKTTPIEVPPHPLAARIRPASDGSGGAEDGAARVDGGAGHAFRHHSTPRLRRGIMKRVYV